MFVSRRLKDEIEIIMHVGHLVSIRPSRMMETIFGKLEEKRSVCVEVDTHSLGATFEGNTSLQCFDKVKKKLRF